MKEGIIPILRSVKYPFSLLTLLCSLSALLPGGAFAQEVLRGQVQVVLEEVLSQEGFDVPHPMEDKTAQRRALEEASRFFSAMIYGWDFSYDIGERARKTPESFDMQSAGEIPWGSPGLRVTEARVEEGKLCIWADYRMTPEEIRRCTSWRSGLTRNLQGVGEAPYGGVPSGEAPATEAPDAESPEKGREAALKDAARSGLRAMLRGMERNRPRTVTGKIALADFPRFWVEGGNWKVQARFRLSLEEVIPFAAY